MSAQEAGSDVEVVVVDDASTDETAEVCKGLKDIKYVRVERNQRTAGARNIGILESSAPIIGFLDDDDWRLPGSLDKQLAVFDTFPEAGVVYGRFGLADQTGKLLDEAPIPQECPSGDLFWKLLEGNIFGCLTAIFRKDCLLSVGLLDAGLAGIDDWDLWIRIGELFPIRAIEETVAVWTKAEPRSGQGSSNESELLAMASRAYRQKWLKLPRVIEELGESFDKHSSRLLRNHSEKVVYDMIYRTQSTKEKIRKLLQVIECYPGRLKEISFYKMLAKNALQKRIVK